MKNDKTPSQAKLPQNEKAEAARIEAAAAVSGEAQKRVQDPLRTLVHDAHVHRICGTH